MIGSIIDTRYHHVDLRGNDINFMEDILNEACIPTHPYNIDSFFISIIESQAKSRGDSNTRSYCDCI